MPNVTKKGRELATALNPSIGTTQEILELCSLICRHAATVKRYAEEYCNRQLRPWEEKRAEQVEKRISELCLLLPQVDGASIKPKFQGDPRGATVKLVMPDGRYDDWGQEGICVPGS